MSKYTLLLSLQVLLLALVALGGDRSAGESRRAVDSPLPGAVATVDDDEGTA